MSGRAVKNPSEASLVFLTTRDTTVIGNEKFSFLFKRRRPGWPINRDVQDS